MKIKYKINKINSFLFCLCLVCSLWGMRSHGCHHHACSIRGFGSDASAVAVEPVIQQLRRRLLRCRLHWLGTKEINGIVAAKHGLSTEVRLLKLPYGLGAKRQVRGRH